MKKNRFGAPVLLAVMLAFGLVFVGCETGTGGGGGGGIPGSLTEDQIDKAVEALPDFVGALVANEDEATDLIEGALGSVVGSLQPIADDFEAVGEALEETIEAVVDEVEKAVEDYLGDLFGEGEPGGEDSGLFSQSARELIADETGNISDSNLNLTVTKSGVSLSVTGNYSISMSEYTGNANVTVAASIKGKYPANSPYSIDGSLNGTVVAEAKSNGNISGTANITVNTLVAGLSGGYAIAGSVNGSVKNGTVEGKLKKVNGEVEGIENLTIKAKPSITIAASIDGKPANKYEIHGSVSGTLSGDVSADFAQESGNITLKPSYTVKATVKGSQGGYTVDGAVNAIVSANISSAFEDDVPDGTLSGGVDARLSVSDGAHGLKLFAQAKLPKTVAELIEDGIEAEYAVYDNDNTKLFEDTFDLSDLFGDDEGDEPEYGGGGY